MPREFIRKSEKNEWLKSTLQEAFTAVRSGRKEREVGRSSNILESTLWDKSKANQSNKLRLGRNPVFNEEQNNAIANHVIKLANIFFETIFDKAYVKVATMDKGISGLRTAGPNKFSEDDFGQNEPSDSTAIQITINLNDRQINIETPVDLKIESSETNQV
ncbi:hypothetical protein HHI36_017312 [Cryptolaemus montrouzieri]|uniref:Uncharacterized protein n=1 Tax=Cryptolaemus montrouzieri TaxID=559131 RepID=A0ABD2NMF3_9CUCU